MRILHVCNIIPLLFAAGSMAAQVTPVLSNPSPCGLQLPITDNNCPENGVFYEPDQFDIQVINAPGSLLGVDVYLKEIQLLIAHPWAGDLDIQLMSPGGRIVLLSSDNGGGDDNYGEPSDASCSTTVRFAVGACTSVEGALAPFTSTLYRPEGDLYYYNDSITNPNGLWRLFICDDIADDVGTLEYVNLVFAPLSCLPVTDIQVLETDTTSVKLSWMPANFCDGITIVEYGPPGFTPGLNFTPGPGGAVDFGTCPPFLLTGLAPDTDYDVYIRRHCGGSDFSINSCGTSIHTGCDPPPITIFEDFNDQVNCVANCPVTCNLTGLWRNGPNDDFDWITYSGKTPTLGTGPSDDAPGGGKFVYIETTGNACVFGSKAYLYSGCIQLDKRGVDTCHFSFNYHLFGTQIGSLRLDVSTNGGFSWAPIWQQSGNLGNQWNKAYISLDNYADGSVLQFRFAGIKGNGGRGDIALDNLVFYGSSYLGFADTQYYVDADNDGYGQNGAFVLSCTATPPAGYVSNNLDCNDNPAMGGANINPGRPEIACDGIDNNCNGPADDPFLPTPTVNHDTICSLQQAVVCATPPPGYQVLWYASPTGNDLVFFGNCFSPLLPPNNSASPVTYRYYASATNFSCFSATRAEAVIVVNPNPDLSSNDTPAVCPGNTFDLNAIQISDANFTGGLITFHSASPANAGNQLSSTTVSPTVTTPYYYLMTSAAGCTDQGIITLSVNPNPQIDFSPADSFSLCKESIATLEAIASNGAGSYSYDWSTGASGSQIEVSAGLQAGQRSVYSVSVTDGLGCFAIDSAIVTTTNSIDSIQRQVINVTTCSGSNGSIFVNPLNGLPPFSYSWTSSNGISGNIAGINGAYTISNLPQGEYRITVTDNSSAMCQLVLRSVLVQGPAAIVEDIDIINVSCPGGENGSICLEVEGGNPQFLWSNDATTPCISNLPGGNYSVTITDGSCETVLNDLVVQEPLPILIRSNVNNPSCPGACNGTIDISVFNGSPGYFFLWSNNKTTQDITQLCAGIYTVTVTDSRSCTYSESFELLAPAPLNIYLQSQEPVTCFGQTNGALLAGAQGGTPPYSFNWSNGNTSSALFGLDAGNYAITVSDYWGCQANTVFTLLEPAPLEAVALQVNLPDCVGDLSGAITVEGQGGTAPYSYVWEGGATTPSRSNLGVGVYTVVVSDSRNCHSAPLTITLSPASALNLAINLQAPPCVGPNTGSIQLQPVGITPFSYQWLRGDVTAQINNVGVGNYPVTITDGRGCVYDTAVMVAAPQVFNVETIVIDPSCANINDGILDVILLETGTAPLLFQWNDGALTPDRANLAAGAYHFNISDVFGCRFSSDTFVLENPPALALNIEELGEITCFGDSTAFVEINMAGGTPPYSYNWVNLGLATEDVYNLPAGDYRSVVLDSRGCAIDTVFSFPSPDPLDVSLLLQSGPPCGEASIDSLFAVVTGGTMPYAYTWSNGEHAPLLIQPAPDDYILTLTDANGCLAVTPSLKVREQVPPLVLEAFTVKPISCFGGSDASITAQVSGGSGTFLYHFTPTYLFTTDADSVTLSSLSLSNYYSVTITDVNTGCQVNAPQVNAPGPLPLFISRDSYQGVNCFGGVNGAIYISPGGGTLPYEFVWYNSEGNLVSTQEDLVNVGADTYTLFLMDANGCTTSLTDTNVVHLHQAISLVDSLSYMMPVVCKGDSSGHYLVELSGGSPPYSYLWSNGSMNEDLLEVPAGMYALTITDSDTCRAIFPLLEIEEPPTAVTISVESQDPSCFQFSNGTITAHIEGGGGPPYDISWARNNNIIENEMDTLLSALSAGLYQLWVADSNQCSKYEEILLLNPPLLVVSIETGVLPGNGGLFAYAETSGGVPGYSFIWNTSETNDTILLAGPGNYSVTVTDAYGCTAGSAVVVETQEPASAAPVVRVYPNPAAEGVWIEWDKPLGKEAWIQLFGADGTLKAAFQLPANGQNRHYLPLESQQAGMYFLVFQAPELDFRFGTKLIVFTQ